MDKLVLSYILLSFYACFCSASGLDCPINNRAILDSQNTKRMKHNLVKLRWSEYLSAAAEKEAKKILNMYQCERSFTNIGEGFLVAVHADYFLSEVRQKNNRKSPKMYFIYDIILRVPIAVTDSWYAREAGNNPSDSLDPLTIKQMLSAESSELGCSRQCCNTGDVWVCLYSPAADFLSQAFQKRWEKKLSFKTIKRSKHHKPLE